MTRRYKAPDGGRADVFPISEDGEVFAVEVFNRTGDLVDYFDNMLARDVIALAVQRGWSPCR